MYVKIQQPIAEPIIGYSYDIYKLITWIIGISLSSEERTSLALPNVAYAVYCCNTISSMCLKSVVCPVFKDPMKSVSIKLYFLVLLYWLVWIKNNVKCLFVLCGLLIVYLIIKNLPPEFSTHLDGIIGTNKLKTWQKTSGNFFSINTLHAVWCAACIRRILVQVLCGSRIGDLESPKRTSRILC